MKTIDAAVKTKWSIDQENSEMGFTVRHLLASHVKGEFKTFDGTITTTGRDFRTARINFWIDTHSITTNNVKRDWHLKSRDFFDVKNHQQITFSSITIGRAAFNGDHDLWGELTMMGITRKVKLNVRFGRVLNDHWGHERVAFTARGIINRSDWGLTWNATMDTGGSIIGEEVEILFELELTNKVLKESEMQLVSAVDNSNLLRQMSEYQFLSV